MTGRLVILFMSFVCCVPTLSGQFLTVSHFNPHNENITIYHKLSDIYLGLSDSPGIINEVEMISPYDTNSYYYIYHPKHDNAFIEGVDVIYTDFTAGFSIVSSKKELRNPSNKGSLSYLSFSHPFAEQEHPLSSDIQVSVSLPQTLIDIVNQVSSDSIVNTISTLSGETAYPTGTFSISRVMTTSWIDSAQQYLMQKIAQYDPDTLFAQEFEAEACTIANIVAINRGRNTSGKCVVLGAHFDDISGDIYAAPGADDNASGCSVVLEALRVLMNFDNENDIIFVLFNGEEYGLYGSNYFLNNYILSEGIFVDEMLNVDMIGNGYPTPSTTYLIASNYKFMTQLYKSISDSISSLAARQIGEMGCSDQVPFYLSGFYDCMATESIFSPFYHSSSDSLKYLSTDMIFDVARISAAFIALCSSKPHIVDSVILFDSGDSSIDVKWINPNDNDFVGCNLYYKLTSDSIYSKIPVSDTTAYSLFIQFPDKQYEIYLTSLDTAGFESYPSQVETITPSFCPHSVSLNKISSSAGSISICYSGSNALDFNCYDILRKSNVQSDFQNIDSTADTFYLDSSITDTLIYSYEVAVRDTSGLSSLPSNLLSSRLVSKERYFLVIDETVNSTAIPDSSSDNFYSSILQDYSYDIIDADSVDSINIIDFGNYSHVIYIKDDISKSKLKYESLTDYLSSEGKFLFFCWNAGGFFSSYSSINPYFPDSSTFLFNNIGIHAIYSSAVRDLKCIEFADGDTSFDIYWDTIKLPVSYNGKLIYGTSFFELSSFVSPIGFNISSSGDTLLDGKPAFLSTVGNNFWVFNAPLYFMHLNEARQIVHLSLENIGVFSSVSSSGIVAKRPSVSLSPVSLNRLTIGFINFPLHQNIKIDIFDCTGRLLTQKEIFYSDVVSKNQISLTCASGIYFISVKAGNFSVIKKTVLLK